MRYARNAYILAAAAWVVAAIAVLFAVFAERTVATAADEGSRSVVERRQRDRRNAAVAFFAAVSSAKDGEDYRAAAERAAKSEPTAHVGGDRDRVNVNSADRAKNAVIERIPRPEAICAVQYSRSATLGGRSNRPR